MKISSVALEPAQWQNDALQILTCTNDYRSMNDFLMKKVSGESLLQHFKPTEKQNTALRSQLTEAQAEKNKTF